MKLMSPAEIKQASESERQKDILRTDTTKKALSSARDELNEVNAKFEVALANQRLRYANEEKEAVTRLDGIRAEIVSAELKLKELSFPIAKEREKAHDLFIQAETTAKDLQKKLKEADDLRVKNEEMSEVLSRRLDEVSDRETKVVHLEKDIQAKLLSLQEEKVMIKNLSKELSIKLSNL